MVLVANSAFHLPTQSSTEWIEAIDCEQIPNLGLYLFIDQIIKLQNPRSKHLKLAVKLLQKNTKVSFCIHPSSSMNPSTFVASMVDQASVLYHKNECARKLKDALHAFQSRWNKETLLDFFHCWNVFTNFFLKERLSEKLSAV